VRPLSIVEAAREWPHRPALVAGGRTHSFAELASRVSAVVAWLDRRGVIADARVALIATPTTETLIVLYALMERGITAVLLHPRLTPAERSSLVDDVSPTIFIEDPVAELREVRNVSPRPFPRTFDDEHELAVLFTSGTTGRPKCVALSRRAFLAAARASANNLGWQSDDRWLLCMPAAHVGGLSIVVRCLVARRTVVLEPKFEPDAIAEVLVRERVTIASFVPTMLARLLEARPGHRAPASLRALLLGGASAPAKLIVTAAECALPVITTYGMTETCSQVTTQCYGTPPALEQGSGMPLDGVEVRVVDDSIEVRGQTMMTGYLGEAASPFTSDGWFQTGDLGALDGAGRLHVLGRGTDRLVTGGENVDPLEVERAIERLPGVRAACVFGVPDETWGEIVCAAIVSDGDFELTPLVNNLAPHKRPRRVAFVDALAFTSSGKLDRRATRALAIPSLTR
jgi:O-succinylbenzoic acid--CoA ligase